MIKAVVFDLDDTLYPERDYVFSGFDVVGATLEERYGIQNAGQRLKELFLQDRKNVYGRILDESGVSYSQKDIEDISAIYRGHKPVLSLPCRSETVLTQLREKGYKLGIITDGRDYQQRAKIAALRVENFVDAIIVTDELGGEQMRKPNPVAFVEMAKMLNVAVEETIYVGDNPNKDFAVKKFLPIKTVEVKGDGVYAFSQYRDGILPDVSVDDIREVASAIEKLS